MVTEDLSPSVGKHQYYIPPAKLAGNLKAVLYMLTRKSLVQCDSIMHLSAQGRL